MNEYISRGAALEELNKPITMSVCLDKTDLAIKRMQRDRDAAMIRAIPAADVAPVVHGHWKVVQRHEHYPSGKSYEAYYCSVCGIRSIEYGQYCPHCGANMIYTEVDA